MPMPVQLRPRPATRATVAAGASSFSSRSRSRRREGPPAAATDDPMSSVKNSVADEPPLAAVAANAGIPNRNVVISHRVVDVPDVNSFVGSLKDSGAHPIVVTFAFDGRAGQMAEFLHTVLNHASLEGCNFYASITNYDSDCAFVYREEFIQRAVPRAAVFL